MRVLLAAIAACTVLAGCGSPQPASPPSAPVLEAPAPLTGAVADCNCAPTAIRISSIGVNAKSITKVGLDSKHEMQVPPESTPKVVAWYKYSPAPGDIGPAVVVSHRNGGGVSGGFAKLDAVKVGDNIEIDRSDGQTATFEAVATELIPKAKMEANQKRIYGNLDHAGLRLVTCSGELDTKAHSYLSQRVVFADLVSIGPTH